MNASPQSAPPPDCVCDEALRGRLRLWQPEQGYRFTVDSFLLADFARQNLPPEAQRVADLCAGCGVVGLSLLTAPSTPATLTLSQVELQTRLATLGQLNAEENGLAPRVESLEADVRQLGDLLDGGQFDLVTANPPYQTVGSGRVPPSDERAIATIELELGLAELIASARRLLRPFGVLALVYPAERLQELLVTLEAEGLRTSRIRPVLPLPGEPARRLLIAAVKGGANRLVLDAPLVVHAEPGVYTPEVAALLGDG